MREPVLRLQRREIASERRHHFGDARGLGREARDPERRRRRRFDRDTRHRRTRGRRQIVGRVGARATAHLAARIDGDGDAPRVLHVESKL
jgi:hypothetical protein